jgi:hypothetical protein
MKDKSEIRFDFVFNPENPGFREFDGLPGFTTLEGQAGTEFRELCRDVVWYHFLEAMDTLLTYLYIDRLESACFKIDLTPGNKFVASVLISGSRPFRSVEKKPVITVSRALLEEYLRVFLEKNHKIPLSESSAMLHELIHVYDRFREESFGLEAGRSRGKSFLLHLLQFRSEGIATLVYTLASGFGTRDIVSARKMFEPELYRIFELARRYPKDYEAFSLGLPDTDTYYTIGPWMVLHALGCSRNTRTKEIIRLVLDNMKRGIRTKDDVLFSLIREALNLTNYSFLKSLTEPEPDGKPFIDRRELSLLVNLIGQIGIRANRGRSFESRDSQMADYYVNKTIKMYNQWGRVNRSRKGTAINSSAANKPVDIPEPHLLLANLINALIQSNLNRNEK